MTVRVRIAPSDTGSIHVGNVRSALFNWLFARHHGGTFIVRIDDTDTERSDPAHLADIVAGLRWLGLDWDEGVEVGGPHGTYKQSDRFDRYRQVAHDLVESGHAYFDDRDPGTLEVLRQRAQQEGKHPGTYIRRLDPPVSDGVIRLAVPQGEAVEFEDAVRGAMRFEPESVDDFVILRSNGVPTYHLASTVDDVDYRISHVIRGEDLLSSTPKHILLARAMGAEPAEYAHLPLLFGPDGKKLSKRHGDTSLAAYRQGGYLPEAVFNFLAILGWSIGEDREIFSADEAIGAFTLDRVSKNPAVFDTDKLLWMNGEYMRAMEGSEFIRRATPWIVEAIGRPLTQQEQASFTEMAPLVQERTKLFTEVAPQVTFLFGDALQYDEASWDKVMSKEGVAPVLTGAADRLAALDPFETGAIESSLRGLAEELGIGAGKAFQPIRVAVTGSSVSPPLFESLASLGRERAVGRIREAADRLASG
ncbi:MAG TPA: glutamate--tRNA ligase [Acidimicrobiia bacterium]|nr:glutamate--tRNA ligase [Acidimicrobiia bacterium]